MEERRQSDDRPCSPSSQPAEKWDAEKAPTVQAPETNMHAVYSGTQIHFFTGAGGGRISIPRHCHLEKIRRVFSQLEAHSHVFSVSRLFQDALSLFDSM
jgi:hypothetical protein